MKPSLLRLQAIRCTPSSALRCLLAGVFSLAAMGPLRAANPTLTYIKPLEFAPAPSAAYPTALADLNGDGRADLVRTIFGNQVAVQLGTGGGLFGAATIYNVGNQATFVEVADFNGDGRPEILVANVNDDSVSVLLGNGNGTFQNQIVTPVGLAVTSMAVTDFDRDGMRDLILVGYQALALEGYVATLRGNGSGGFTDLTIFSASVRTQDTQTRGVAVADLNGDTYPDFVVSDPRNVAAVVSFLNNQNGTFTRHREMSVPGNVGRLTLGDFNGDGRADLAFVLASDTDFGNTGPGSNVGVAMGNGDGTFGTLTANGALYQMGNVTIYGAGSTADTLIRPEANILAADMDGNGTLDLVTVAEPSSGAAGLIGYVAILRGVGNGTFTFGNRATAPYQSLWVSLGEINGDGERDMVVTPNNATTQAYIAVSNNLGALTVTTSVDEDDGSTNPALGTGASLREAVNHANSLGGAQTITFSPALAGQTMSLTITGDNTFGPSALRVNANLTIQGLTGTNGIRIARGSSSSLRLFFVNQTATLTLNELVLADGSISGQGGAVYNYGTLRVNRCTLRNNTGSFGGAIGSGGGAAGQTVVVTNSTLISNRASFGGAIHSDTTSSLSLTNVTVITNDVTTNSGGGIRCDGPATIVNSMIVGNFNLNGDPSDVSASLDSSSHHNFIGSGGSGGLVNGVNGNRVGNDDPRVDFLPDLIALRADSPCINAGATVSGLTTDQRGVARPQYGAFDIGAYEFDGTLTESLVVTTTTDENDGNSSPVLGTGTSLREAIAYAGALNDNSAVTFSPAMGGQTFIVNGALSLGGTASLDGGTSGVTVRASASRIFDVTGNWTLRNLTATGGRLSGSTQAGWGPGALVNTGASLTVDRCLFLDHESNVGGGITSRGTLHIVNSTFTNNRTTASTLNSGVIWLFGGTGIIRHSTFTGNSGPFTIKADNATLTFDNNIVWGNGGTAMGRNNSTFAGTNNLLQSGDTTGLTHTINADPLLGSLFANGGPTRTFALLGDSPAIDAATTIFGVTTDQRGVARPVGAAPDLGAFENADTALQRWRAFHSLPANGSQDLANPSTDGVANLLKFAFNLAPNLGDLASSNTSILPENGTAGLPFLARDAQGRLFIEFVRRKATSHPGVGYLVETGADLSTLTPLDLSGASAVSIGATWERVTVIDPVITPKRFGRVRVTTLP